MKLPAFIPVLIALAFALLTSARGADEVSRKPPERYVKDIAPLLTPLEKVLESAKSVPKDGDGVVLLHEEIHWVTEDGRRFVVEHIVNLANTEAGVAAMVESSRIYKKADTQIYLARAQSVQPDGTRIEVEGKAAMLHSPQPDADMAVYGDVGEMRIVFPGVKPGVITEQIAVMDQSELAIPGELMTDAVWASAWLIAQKRVIVDAPDAITSRLRVIPVGMADPGNTKKATGAGRSRMEWQAKDLPAITPEPGQPPWMRTGPALAFTTLSDWNGVTRWFTKLAEERSSLPDAALYEIAEKSKLDPPPDPKARQSLLASLLKKVSDDVRYTGLEFGLGAYQPREPSQVWATRYGDCKDKSNLLRVLLARHGVKSWLALVNTEHDGEVSRDCPSVRWFNHVVLAVDDGQGGVIWCDPTMTHVPPGQLGSGVGERDVLLVREGTADWRRTPQAFTGEMVYEAELKPRAEGGWTGSVQITGRGLSGIQIDEYFDKSDRQQALNIVQWITSGLVPRGEVLDFVREKQDKLANGVTFSMKVFLDVTGVPGHPPEARAPQPSWENEFTTLRTRRTAMFQSRMKRLVKVRYMLPKGTSAGALPRALTLKTPCFASEARWESDAASCTSTVTWETLSSVVSPDDYDACHSAAQTLAAWTDKTVPFIAAGDTPVDAAPADDMLVMPTGEGQIALIERRLPFGGNAQMRRAALARVAELFPRDHTAAFAAEVLISNLDVVENKADAAARRLRDVLSRLGGKVSADDISWAEGVLVYVLKTQDKRKEAGELAAKSFAREGVSPERRAFIGLYHAELCAETDSALAIKVLRQCAEWQSMSLPRVFNQLTQLLVEKGDNATLAAVVRDLYVKGMPQVVAAYSGLPTGALELSGAGKSGVAAKWLDAVDSATGADIRSSVAASFTQARAQLEASGLGSRIQSRLKEFLDKGGFSSWNQMLPEYASGNADDTGNSFVRLNQQGRPLESLRYGLRRLVSFPPDEAQAYLLSQVADVAFQARDYAPEAKGVLDELLQACDMLPASHPSHLEGRLLRSQVVAAQSEAEAERILRELLAAQDLPHDLWVRATAAHAVALHHLGRTKEALQANESLLPYATNAVAFLSVIRAVMQRVEIGDYEKACDLTQKLQEPFGPLKPYLDSAETVSDLLALSQDPKKAAEYWDSTKTWWPAWEKFERNVGLKMEHSGGTMLLTNSRNIGNLLEQNLSAGDVNSALQLLGMAARSARVSPFWTFQLGSVATFASTRFGQHQLPLLSVVRDLVVNSRIPEASLTPGMDVTRLILMQEPAYVPRALEYAARRWLHFQTHDVSTSAFARVWLGTAMRVTRPADQAIASAAVQVTLDAPENAPGVDRGLSVSMLGSAYMLLRQPSKAARLMERELVHPAIKGSSYETRIKDQLSKINTTDGDPVAFGDAVKKWFAAQPRLAWLDQVEPTALGSGDLKEMPSPDFSKPGNPAASTDPISVQMKRTYLLLTSSEVTYTRKLDAWHYGVAHFLRAARSPARDISAWIRQALDDPAFPEPARLTLLGVSIEKALSRGAHAEAAEWLAHPLAPKLAERARVPFERRLRVEQCDVTSPEAVKKLAASLNEQPEELYIFGISSWSRLLRRVHEHGQFATADWMIDHPGDATGLLQPTQQKQKQDEAVVLMKVLQLHRSEKRFHEWKDGTVVRAFTPWLPKDWKSASRPPLLDHLGHRDMLMLCKPEDIWSAWSWSLAHEPGLAIEWGHLGSIIELARQHVWKGDTRPVISLLACMKEQRVTDTDLTKIIEQIGWALVNWNDVKQREAFMLVGRKTPQAAARILTELERAALVRVGLSARDEIEALDLGTRLGVYLANGDSRSMRTLLERTPAETLLDEGMIALTIRAYRFLQMEAEARIAAIKARKLIKQHVAESWAVLDMDAIASVITLWSALGEPDAVPVAWSQDMGRYIEAPYWRGIVLTRSATIRQDWPEALKQAEALLNAEPDNTSFEYDRAGALIRLGRAQEARASIDTFMRTQGDNPNMHEVKQWLEKTVAQ
jgi:tetratricopeptide (TPR) repeat protein